MVNNAPAHHTLAARNALIGAFVAMHRETKNHRHHCNDSQCDLVVAIVLRFKTLFFSRVPPGGCQASNHMVCTYRLHNISDIWIYLHVCLEYDQNIINHADKVCALNVWI